MEYSSIISEAFITLTVNKLRSSLATLGIVIGIGNVIALISLGQGSQKSIENQIQSLGSNLLTVIPGGQMQGWIKGGAGFNNPDDAIYVPLSTAQKQIFGENRLTSIAIEASSPDVMTQTQNDVGYLLLARHKLNDPTEADFMIFFQNDILSTISQVTGTFTMLLEGIAAVSLLVGGIGIMNIMLVTVTERTREIGLRKALGAQKKAIITQFLIESIILTITGGLIGIGLGVMVSYILSQVINIPFTISPTSILLAVGVSGAIGILFGWYPARKAANLQPIEALRYE